MTQRSLGWDTWWGMIEYPDFATLPIVWQSFILYITLDTNKIYRWNWVDWYDELSAWGWWNMTKVEYDVDQDGKVDVAEEAEKIDAWTF